MVLDSTDANSVLLVAEELSMVQQADMNLFYITEQNLVNMSDPQKGVKMELKMRRKIMSEMMTTYLPSELPSLAQMTFTQCASMSDLKFDSVAPPGGQIHQYVSFSVLFQSPTKDMAQKYGSTVKNLILGFSPKLSGGVLIYVWKPGKNFGPKSQC